MFQRKLARPSRSAFLFGPRGTGKSTWLRQHFATAKWYDLLETGEQIRLSKDPSRLFAEVSALPAGATVVIDEIQKVPALLNEVHRLIEARRTRVIMSGSSARKLKRGAANLLAGRAAGLQLFSLTSAEVGFLVEPRRMAQYGMLPMSVTASDPIPYLRAYVETYLKEEIVAEALTRNLGGFARFLEVAARQNGQITNVTNIARDAEVSRQTVQGYFDILQDTLIGGWLPAWQLKRSTKQVAHSKFFFFDAGVARSLSGRLPYPPTAEEFGHLLETVILQEVRAYLAYTERHYTPFFWSSHDGVEVDLLCETQRGYVAIEIKGGSRWEPRFGKGLLRVREELGARKVRCYGVYTGRTPAVYGAVRVLPVVDFLRALWVGTLLP